MTSHHPERIARLCGASAAHRHGRIQSVWSGYGEVLRYDLVGAAVSSVVVKSVRPPAKQGFAHERKLRSYDVELAWYRDFAGQLDPSCRIPKCLHAESERGTWLFILEDLDVAGFTIRTRDPSDAGLHACLRWFAAFHAQWLGVAPQGLWDTGTYWHLDTRPDEHAAMPVGRLRAAAPEIDRRLREAHWQTFVHGDAKPANFCFNVPGDAVAAVDFQYVGRGVGVSDVAYVLAGCDAATVRAGKEVYFAALREALKRRRVADSGFDIDVDGVEAEWRALYPWAWADYQRFLAGWAPGRWSLDHEQAMTETILNEVPSR